MAELILIDDRRVVACPTVEAMRLLDGPDRVAAWFGAVRHDTSTTIASDLVTSCSNAPTKACTERIRC